MSQLTCENLSLGYDRKVVLRDLSFSVDKGDYLCIVGENGSGKSTLIKTIVNLQTAISGNISVGEGLSFKEIGYLPQQTEIQKDFPASVKEVVLSGFLNRIGLRPYFNVKEKQQAKENMEMLGISSLYNRCFRELSGGQQQRVLLARALCATGKMLLLDEPVAGLDPKASDEMYGLIKKLNDRGITVIMISHDVFEAIGYASHILHLGRDIFFGTKEEYVKTHQYKHSISKGGYNK